MFLMSYVGEKRNRVHVAHLANVRRDWFVNITNIELQYN